jgi:hypothetical protein
MPHAAIDEPLQVLEDKLLGRAYTAVHLGDWWALAFYDGLWLLAQRIVSQDEPAIRAALSTASVPMLEGVDAEDLPAMAALLRSRRQPVTGVALDASGALNLEFADGHGLRCSTGEKVVDWQWAVNETGSDPYLDFSAACFTKGEVVVGGAA